MLDVLRRYVYPSTDNVAGDAYRRVLRIHGALALVEVGAWAGEAAHYVMSRYVLDAYPVAG